MMDWLFVSPAQRRLLPGGRFRGPTPWVIAIMTFVMMIVTAAALALANGAGVVAEGSSSRFVVQLPDGARTLAAATNVLEKTVAVSKVEPVPEKEMRATLERWLGPEASSRDLPVPALIHFDLADPALRPKLAQQLSSVAPGAVISAHDEEVKPLLSTMRALQWIALSLVLLMVGATSATVVLAARGALDTNKPTIEVMHGIGATDIQVAHLFQRKIALDAFAGAMTGAAAAALTLLLLAGGSAALAGQLGGLPALGGGDLLLLALLPVALVALATWVARMAVLTSLRDAT